MDKETIKNTVAQNIVSYRKLNNLSQLELAEKVNYSDKSVSKWERGESLPDVILLTQLAELFGVTLNDMVSHKQTQTNVSHRDRKHLFITLMSIGLVWLVASIVNFFFNIFNFNPLMDHVVFFYAIPASFIVAVVFTFLWFNRIFQFISVSLLAWTLAICGYYTVNCIDLHSLFIIAGVFQGLAILWFLFMHHSDRINSK